MSGCLMKKLDYCSRLVQKSSIPDFGGYMKLTLRVLPQFVSGSSYVDLAERLWGRPYSASQTIL